jgi:hypothetical protein
MSSVASPPAAHNGNGTTNQPTPDVTQHPRFQETLDTMLARALAALPEAAQTLQKAYEIVLSGGVVPGEGHAFRVQSQTQPHIRYIVNGSCPCPAAQHAPEPCKHKLASFLYRRVVAALHASDQGVSDRPEQTPPPAPPEPASALPADALEILRPYIIRVNPTKVRKVS